MPQNYADSSAARIALSAGVKTQNNAVNRSDDGRPLRHIRQVAEGAGRALPVLG